jgi:hypothetical protein
MNHRADGSPISSNRHHRPLNLQVKFLPVSGENSLSD